MLIKNIRKRLNKKELIALIDEHKKLYDIKNKERPKEYTHSLLDYNAIQQIKKLKGSVLEIGAGHGLNAKLLKYAGITVYPIDKKQYDGVEQMDYREAIKKYKTDILLLVWPSYNSNVAYNSVKLFNGCYVIYVGEPEGYATANDKFFELLDTEYKEIYKRPLPAFYDYFNMYPNQKVINYFAIYTKI